MTAGRLGQPHVGGRAVLMTTRDLFNRHSLRCTRQRIALYDTLRKCRNHPTAEELYRMARSDTSGLSRATVYNTLEALCKAGLAKQLPTTNGCCRYDADISEHLHLRDRQTDEIHDVPVDLGRQLIEQLPRETLAAIESHMGIKIDGISIQLHGRKVGLPSA
jgi:Fe2+ or Zn2+ uptake regulation protein